MQRIDVTEGLESTLVMLAHKLAPGVVVQRATPTTCRMVEAFAGELNQVWTNLIDNAIDAMDGDGSCGSRPTPTTTASSSRSGTPAPG